MNRAASNQQIERSSRGLYKARDFIGRREQEKERYIEHLLIGFAGLLSLYGAKGSFRAHRVTCAEQTSTERLT